MAINRVQFKHSYTGATPQTATFTSNVTVGNIIVVAGSGIGNPATIACSDNLGNTYSTVNHASTTGVGTNTLYVFYAQVTTGGSCSLTLTSTSGDLGFTAVEYSGLGSSPAVTSAIFDQSSSTNEYVSLSVTVGDLLFAAYANEHTIQTLGAANGNFTIFQHDTSHYDAQEDWLGAASTTSYNVGFTATSGSADTIVIGVDFTPASGGGGPTNYGSTLVMMGVG